LLAHSTAGATIISQANFFDKNKENALILLQKYFIKFLMLRRLDEIYILKHIGKIGVGIKDEIEPMKLERLECKISKTQAKSVHLKDVGADSWDSFLSRDRISPSSGSGLWGFLLFLSFLIC